MVVLIVNEDSLTIIQLLLDRLIIEKNCREAVRCENVLGTWNNKSFLLKQVCVILTNAIISSLFFTSIFS